MEKHRVKNKKIFYIKELGSNPVQVIKKIYLFKNQNENKTHKSHSNSNVKQNK